MPVQEGNTYRPVYLNAAARERRNIKLADYLDRRIDQVAHLDADYEPRSSQEGDRTLAALIHARDIVRGW